MKRTGFTIVELIVATIVMGILGTVLVQIMWRDSRFVSQVESLMNARQGARAAMTIMTAELSTTSDSGLIAATTKSVTIRVPYAFGMACRTQGNNLYASLSPTDSMTFVSATASGVAWRDSTGTYQFIPGITVRTNAPSSQCTADSIRVIPGGQTVRIRRRPDIAAGRIIYLYQDVTYSFEASTSLPGRIGLFRTDGSGDKMELLSPFDAAAGFAFLIGPTLTPTTSVPGDLTTVRGLQLILTGESYQNPQGTDEPAEFTITTSVIFRNRVN